MAGGTTSAKGPKGNAGSGTGRTTPKGTRPGDAGGKGSGKRSGTKDTDKGPKDAPAPRARGRRRHQEPENSSPHHRQPGHRRKGTRYTPPVSKKSKKSPRWLAGLMIGLFLAGVLLIILNYADLLPGGVNNWWLVGAIGAIFAGLIVATTYR